MAGKRFSVVLPVRNGGEHLKLCVASILAQTLINDFELLILENGSTDGTAQWLTGLRDARVHVYPSERSLEIEENWARILQIPRGEFMTAIGHDDLLDANYLAEMSKLIEAHPDAGLYQAHFRLINGAGEFVGRCAPMPIRETAAEFLASRLGMLRESYGTGYLMRSSDYDRVGGIPASFQKLNHADDALWIRLMEGTWKATSPHELFSYRTHDSTSRTLDPSISLQTTEQYVCFLQDVGTRDPAVKEVLERYGPNYLSVLGDRLHLRFLHEDLGGGAQYSTELRERVSRFAGMLGTAGGPPPFRSKEAKFLVNCSQRPFGGLVYRGVRAIFRSLQQLVQS